MTSALLEWIQAGHGIGSRVVDDAEVASAENADPSTALIAINFAQKDDTFWGGEGLGVAKVEVLRRNSRVVGDAEVKGLASAENADPSTALIAIAINFAQDDTFWGGEGLGVLRVEVLRRNSRVVGDAEVTSQ